MDIWNESKILASLYAYIWPFKMEPVANVTTIQMFEV